MKPRRKRLSPQAVADACLERAWQDECPDYERSLLELASKTIEMVVARVVTNAKVLEVVEAELAAMKYPLLDDDDPGAAL